MTEIVKREISWNRFFISLIAAPLLVTALTFWIYLIPYFALIMGGPVYLVFGTPLLTWYLRRNQPRVLPIILLALISLLGLVPIALIAWVITGDTSVFEMLMVYFIYGSVFAILWSATFALIYKRLIRDI